MIKNLQDTVTLHNGVKMPGFGLGVFKVEEGQELVAAVKAAIRHGYRSIDTAAVYQNEAGVGTRDPRSARRVACEARGAVRDLQAVERRSGLRFGLGRF